MTSPQKNNLANSLRVKLVKQPGKYLGINFKLRGNRKRDFQDLIHKVTTKLQGWKARLLSQASRLTLINSVLNSIPICNKLDSIVNAFWWGHDPKNKKNKNK